MKIGVPKEIISQEYRVAINPETAKLLIESSHQLFIQKNVITMMGFQMRFNPLIKFLEKTIKKKSPIGKLITAHIHHCENIKDFHPYEDYRVSYAAKKKLGGGVILSQIHEVDYFLHLFQNYQIVLLDHPLFLFYLLVLFLKESVFFCELYIFVILFQENI